jgi:hypothetical protein
MDHPHPGAPAAATDHHHDGGAAILNYLYRARDYIALHYFGVDYNHFDHDPTYDLVHNFVYGARDHDDGTACHHYDLAVDHDNDGTTAAH